MDQIKVPIALRTAAAKHPELNSNLEDVAQIPRASRLNPNFLLLAYYINGEIDSSLPKDFLHLDKIYGGKTLDEWINSIFSANEKRNKYKLLVELLSYVMMLREKKEENYEIHDYQTYDVDAEKYRMEEQEDDEEEDEDGDEEKDYY